MKQLFLLVSCLAFSVQKPLPKPSALDSIIDKFQKTWDETKSYQAKFKQSVVSKEMGGTPEETTGQLIVQKPGKLRWESDTDKSTQILNGTRLISIQENLRRKTKTVDIYKDVTRGMDTKALQFLAGRSDFRETYKIDLVKDSTSMAQLKLVPKTGTTTETYIAEIDKNSYFLRSLTTETADSRVRLEFLDVKANIVIDEKSFDYTPSSTDIVNKQ